MLDKHLPADLCVSEHSKFVPSDEDTIVLTQLKDLQDLIYAVAKPILANRNRKQCDKLVARLKKIMSCNNTHMQSNHPSLNLYMLHLLLGYIITEISWSIEAKKGSPIAIDENLATQVYNYEARRM